MRISQMYINSETSDKTIILMLMEFLSESRCVFSIVLKVTELEYLLTDDIILRSVRDEQKNVRFEAEIRWKF